MIELPALIFWVPILNYIRISGVFWYLSGRYNNI